MPIMTICVIMLEDFERDNLYLDKLAKVTDLW